MPRERQKRGKRSAPDKKRSRDDQDDADDASKRRRTLDMLQQEESFIPLPDDENPLDEDDAPLPVGRERRFYGLLDENEQEYFKHADEMLETNQFRDADDRSLFIANVHKEASGKELKLACSQATSRLMERIILLSTPDQLKFLFKEFHGEFPQLMSHRFASHCCEALFIHSAPIVRDELASESKEETDKSNADENKLPTMEETFLDVAKELEGNIGYLITQKYASHVLRVLLVILAGQPINASQQRSLLSGKRKEHVDVTISNKPTKTETSECIVPQSFKNTLQQIIEQSVIDLDTSAVRMLATHKTGNPTLQVLLQLELTHIGKQRGQDSKSIVRKLLPEESFLENSDNSRFLNGIIFDPVGSHLLECLVEHVPGKTFKTLNAEFLKPRLSTFARNDTASYVVCRVLQRYSATDLEAAMNTLIPQISTLIERGRYNVLKTIAERSAVRDVDATAFADAFKASSLADDNSTLSLKTLLQLPSGLPGSPKATEPDSKLTVQITPTQNAASSLIQSMLRVPGPLSTLVFDALSNTDSLHIKYIALNSPLSPILQVALTAATATVIFKRKLITHLYGSIAALSISPSASHVIDAVERCSRKDLGFVRERIAEELAESESLLLSSSHGRKVWKNWDMNLYRRNRSKWISITRKKVGNNGFQSLPGLLGNASISAKEKGKGPFGQVHATLSETAQNTHHVVHDHFCRPAKEKSKNALDRAREKYSQAHTAPASDATTWAQTEHA